MAALHVGSERSLAGFDALSGVSLSHARRLEGSADLGHNLLNDENLMFAYFSEGNLCIYVGADEVCSKAQGCVDFV